MIGQLPSTLMALAEVVDAQLRALDDALQCADRNWFAAVIGDDHLASIRMSPFLMTAFLANFLKAVAPQNTNDIIRVADGKALAH